MTDGGRMETNRVYCMDALELCHAVADSGLRVDMILADLPYETTANEWDEAIPFEAMWAAFHRARKDGAPVVLTASQPFTTRLIASNLREFRYEWIWIKSQATGFLDANRKPLKAHESVLVFCDQRTPYYPQMGKGLPYKSAAKANSTTNYGSFGERLTVNDGDRYPRTTLEFQVEVGLHPTQKPTALFEYLIRTYTQPGELVLDPTCGSGTTAVAARQTGRQFIVGDLSPEYVAVTERRLAQPYTVPMFERVVP